MEDALPAEDDPDGDRQATLGGCLPHSGPERPGVVEAERVDPQLGLLGEDLVVKVGRVRHGSSA
nr:hypothetical protein DA06_11380 [Georgenia sp. SUBG003]